MSYKRIVNVPLDRETVDLLNKAWLKEVIDIRPILKKVLQLTDRELNGYICMFAPLFIPTKNLRVYSGDILLDVAKGHKEYFFIWEENDDSEPCVKSIICCPE